MIRSGRLRGYAAVMGAATLWGVAGVVAKSLFNRHLEPKILLEIRLTGAFVVLLIILFVSKSAARVPREMLGRLALLGLAMTAAQFTYYTTISLTDVATALFLQYTAPVLVTLYARIAEREPISALKAGAIGLAVVGSYFLVSGSHGMRIHPLGLTTGLLSAAAFGVYAVLGRGVRQIASWTVLLYALGSGAVVWSLVVVPPWRAYLVGYRLADWAAFGFIIVFATILPFGLFLYGLRAIPASLASLTATLEPVVGSAAAVFVLGERLAAPQILGALAIAGAVALIQLADLLAVRTERVLPPPAPD
ncbi:MAG TPA: EamA family transporter [bacterium]|nr:EamA family transporter [bacterium]